MYFLDTNVCIHYLNGSDKNVISKLDISDLDQIKIPSVVAAELYYGAYKSSKREHNLARVSLFLEQFEAVLFDVTAAMTYGDIRTDLERKGEIIGWNDLLIAAIAKAAKATLVTNNLKEFSRVAGLLVEDWSQTDK